MSEPLDPIAAGVAAVLKSLRTRAGLQEGRLAGTELALDPLTGLGSVREFIAVGDSVERAIVRAVSAAAGTLEPTYSIVADVSLGLGLSADLLPGSDLYSGDLGRRRAALLENWDRLHELRSAPLAGPAPTPRALRLEVEAVALSELAKALTGTYREQATLGPTVTAMPPGPRAARQSERAIPDRPGEPSEPGVEPDAAPGSGVSATGLIVREARASAPPRLVRAQVPLLIEEFHRITRALRDSLLHDDDGPGWTHDLRKGSKPTTDLATAFGLKAMLLLEGFLAPDLKPVAERLRRKPASPKSAGYAARVQKEARPEATAAVLSTLHMLDGTTSFEAQLATVKNGMGEFEKTRPFILTTVLETSTQLGADPELTRSLIKDLLAARKPYGNLLLWPEKAERSLVAPAPSIAHTARAVRALALAQAGLAADNAQEALAVEVQEATDQAAAWLAEQQDPGNVSEIIDRQEDGGGIEPVYVRHFTAAWVVKALVSVGLPASHPSVSSAVARIWSDYSIKAALWSWRNGDLPVWMTLDAVDALRLAALAATTRSGGFDAS